MLIPKKIEAVSFLHSFRGSVSWIRPLLFDAFLLLIALIYFIGGVEYDSRVYLRHGADLRRAFLLIGVAGFFMSSELRTKSIFLKGGSRLLAQLTQTRFRWKFYILLALSTCLLAIFQTLALRVTLYDVGIFHQILWGVSHGYGFHSTISKAGNFLLDHFSPTLALLVPFFQFSGETVFFLPVVQVLLVFAGGAAWIYFAERVPVVIGQNDFKFRGHLAAATTIFIFGFDSLWANFRWGFHENAIAFAALSWGFSFLFLLLFQFEKDFAGSSHLGWRRVWILILFLLAAFSKEILLVDVAGALILWAGLEVSIFHNKDRKKKIERTWLVKLFPILLGLLSLCLFWIFIRFELLDHPADKNYFDRYYSYLGKDFISVLGHLGGFPNLILAHVGWKELLAYFSTVFSPWFFLPWLAFGLMFHRGRLGSFAAVPFWMVSMLPSFLSAALATFSPLRSHRFHYVLELWPILAVITLFSLAYLRDKRWVWLWAFVSLLRWDQDPLSNLKHDWAQKNKLGDLIEVLKKLPPDAYVMADDQAGPWVAGRRWVTRWPDEIPVNELGESGKRCPDYWVLQSGIDPRKNPQSSKDNQSAQGRIFSAFPHCFRSGFHPEALNQIHHSSSWTVFHRGGDPPRSSGRGGSPPDRGPGFKSLARPSRTPAFRPGKGLNPSLARIFHAGRDPLRD